MLGVCSMDQLPSPSLTSQALSIHAVL
jgi:hypothetical protein